MSVVIIFTSLWNARTGGNAYSMNERQTPSSRPLRAFLYLYLLLYTPEALEVGGVKKVFILLEYEYNYYCSRTLMYVNVSNINIHGEK